MNRFDTTYSHPSGQDLFLGHWRVKELAFGADGAYLGSIKQERKVWKTGVDAHLRDVLRVDQHCAPDLLNQNHAMAEFSGAFSFELIKSGVFREYRGPDVIGGAVALGTRSLMGQGYWPRFDCNFSSWSVNWEETRQATGGVFYRGPQIVAVIYGDGRQNFGDGVEPIQNSKMFKWLPPHGTGTLVKFNSSYEVISEEPVECERTSTISWRETTDKGLLEYNGTEALGYLKWVDQRGHRGTAKEYGPVLMWKSCGVEGEFSEGIEVFDPVGHRFFALRKQFKFGKLHSIETLVL